MMKSSLGLLALMTFGNRGLSTMSGTTFYRYDTDHDVMYVQLGKYTPAESVNYVDDKIVPNINEIRDERNEDLVGFIILDYRRNKPELVKRYPEYFF